MERCRCSDCGKQLSVNSIIRHKKKSCKAKNKQRSNDALASKSYDKSKDAASYPSYEEQQAKPKIPQLSAFVNSIINDKPKTIGKNVIQLAKRNDIYTEQKHSKSENIPDFDPIGPSSSADEESGDDTAIKYPVAKRRKTVSKPTKFIKIPLHQNDSDDSVEEDESVCSKYSPPPIQFLPENKDDLFNRANELFSEYRKEKRVETRNELVAVLDELNRRNFIDREAYRKLNDYLSGIPGSGLLEPEEMEIEEEEENEEIDVLSKISDTLAYVIQHDRNEIEELLKVFEKEGDTYWEDDVSKLRKLVEHWIEEEILGKETVLQDISNLLIKLQKSGISRHKLIRFESILNDIRGNRHRVTDAIRKMATVLDKDNEKDQLRTLNQLLVADIISEEQYDALKKKMKEDGLDLDDFIREIKQVKVGRGLRFLPRITSGLFDKLKYWLADYAQEETGQLRTQLLAILDELLQRKAISKREHKDKIEQHDLD